MLNLAHILMNELANVRKPKAASKKRFELNKIALWRSFVLGSRSFSVSWSLGVGK